MTEHVSASEALKAQRAQYEPQLPPVLGSLHSDLAAGLETEVVSSLDDLASNPAHLEVQDVDHLVLGPLFAALDTTGIHNPNRARNIVWDSVVEGRTQEELGDEWGVDRRRAGQITQDTLRDLRRLAKQQGLRFLFSEGLLELGDNELDEETARSATMFSDE